MRLSEAILLGTTVGKFDSGRYLDDGCGCAQGLGYMAATGKRDGLAREIAAEWPWLLQPSSYRGIAAGLTSNYQHAIGALAIEMTCGVIPLSLEKLCDQVRAWEDELAAKGINVEQVTMIATSETIHEPAPEHSHKPEYMYRGE